MNLDRVDKQNIATMLRAIHRTANQSESKAAEELRSLLASIDRNGDFEVDEDDVAGWIMYAHAVLAEWCLDILGLGP